MVFDKVFRKYYHPLFLYCLKFVENEADARDIIQNIFTRVWEKKKYRLEEKHLKSYFFNATRNACINYLKHVLVEKRYESEICYALKELEINYYKNGERSLIEKEGLQKIYRTIDSLSEKDREILQLSRFEGLKNQEIAEQLDIPIRTVETRLFRAIKKLREKLTKQQIQLLFHLFQKK